MNMASSPAVVNFRILDKEFRVSCTPDEETELLKTARYLDERMRDIRDNGKIVGMDRIAVMAALNISHEYLHQHEQLSEQVSVSDRIRALQSKIDLALNGGRQLEL
jgi:cell division protein ZapA